MSMVGTNVREACIDDKTDSYGVEAEGCTKTCAIQAQRHKKSTLRENRTCSRLTASAYSCMSSLASDVRRRARTRVSRKEISCISAAPRNNVTSEVLRVS